MDILHKYQQFVYHPSFHYILPNTELLSYYKMPRSRKHKDDQYIAWEDLDLDVLLGEYTDMPSEADSSAESVGEVSSPPRKKAKSAESVGEVSSPPPKSAKDPAALYQCPECPKTYRSVAGFRGHMTKKHNLPSVRGVL